MVYATRQEIKAFIAESNRIEGIRLRVGQEDIKVFQNFLNLSHIEIPDVVAFVNHFAPGAKLRVTPDLNVRVGRHIAPKGGDGIVAALRDILEDVNTRSISSWEAHVRYETLHPFTDGNGRSGRAIWAWHEVVFPLGFLHKFYYQTLDGVKR